MKPHGDGVGIAQRNLTLGVFLTFIRAQAQLVQCLLESKLQVMCPPIPIWRLWPAWGPPADAKAPAEVGSWS